MSALTLKIIACITMLLDHIGAAWGIAAFRYIGRISFPIFAFLIAVGYRHTKSLGKYMSRLAVFAVLSEIPFDLLFYHRVVYMQKQNIYFTLLIGLCCIAAVDRLKEKHIFLTLIPIALCCAIATFGYYDYGFIGVLTVLAFHLFYGDDRKNRILLTAAIIITSCWCFISFYTANYVLDRVGFDLRANSFTGPLFYTSPQPKQMCRIFALIPIFLYSGKKGRQPTSKVGGMLFKFGFYAFYPAHLLILYFLSQCI